LEVGGVDGGSYIDIVPNGAGDLRIHVPFNVLEVNALCAAISRSIERLVVSR
jgi:hypothetical protein